MRHLLRRLLIFAFVLMQFQGVIAAWPALRTTAQSSPEETIIMDNAVAKVTVKPEREERDIAWRIKYKRYAGTTETPRAVRFRFARDINGNGVVVPRGELPVTTQQDDPDWYRETPSATEAESEFTVTTPADAENLVVWVQVDEYASLDGTVTSLLKDALAEDAEPVVVPAPVVPEPTPVLGEQTAVGESATVEKKEDPQSTSQPETTLTENEPVTGNEESETPQKQPEPAEVAKDEEGSGDEHDNQGTGTEVPTPEIDESATGNENSVAGPNASADGSEDITTDDKVETDTESVGTDDEEPMDADKGDADNTTADEDLIEADDEAVMEIQPAPGSILNGNLTRIGLGLPVLRAGATTNTDPFDYTDDVEGHYPTNGTHDSLNGANDAIMNYDYGTATDTDEVLRADVSGNGLTFASGYHAYKDDETLVGYTKKTIQQVSPNRYKVQLDMIGDAIKTYPDVDVVLVLDRSSSMMTTTTGTATRWSELQSAVGTFATNLLTDSGGHIRIGMAGFGSRSATNSGTTYPYGRIATFGPITGSSTTGYRFSGYTTSATSITSHSLLTEEPVWSGTPTFLGLDAGLHLLMNPDMGARDGVKKVLVTITDGEPTFWPGANYNTGTVSGSLGNATASTYNNRTVNYTLNNTSNRTYYGGEGTAQQQNTSPTSTVSFINNRLNSSTYSGVSRYAIGFYQGMEVNDTLTALGPNGTYAATNLSQLMTALSAITGSITATISGAVLRDPLSQYVEYMPNTTHTVRALTLQNGVITESPGTGTGAPQYAQDADVVRGIDGYTISNLNLGGDGDKQYGYRLTYEVKLKADYQDGLFYPANGVTSLENNAGNEKDYLHFAVPSVRHEGVETGILVEKNWVDDENAWDTRDDILIQLQRHHPNNTTWVNVGEPRRISQPQTRTIFADVDYYNGNGTSRPYTYRVVETTPGGATFVPGYKAPTYTNPVVPANGQHTITVTNELKKTDYTFYKVDQNDEPLTGAEFEVTRGDEHFADLTGDDNGKFTITGMPIGSYKVTETKAPDGYDGGADFELAVNDNGANALKIEGVAPDYKVVNRRIQYGLELLKLDQDGNPLKNAYFSIKGPDVDTTGVTDDDGRLVLETPITDLKSGEYTIKETKAPVGYIKLSGTFTLTIPAKHEEATLEYDGSELGEGDFKVAVEREKGKDGLVTLTVKNHKREETDIPLPLSGGPGLRIAIVIGLVLMGAAGYWQLVAWRRRRGGDGHA